MDQAAREIGMDPAEFRQKNFIPKGAFPYQTPVALVGTASAITRRRSTRP